jgi:hypothetical protein
LIVQQIGSNSPIEYHPLPQDDPKRRQPVISRARTELGWSPRIPLDQGLSATIDYFSLKLFTEAAAQPVPDLRVARRSRNVTRAAPANGAARRDLAPKPNGKNLSSI